MDFFHIVSFIIVLAAGFAYINYKFIKLPGAIGLMILGLVLSLALQAFGILHPAFEESVKDTLTKINFSDLVLEFILSFLLFAGALHTDMDKLKSARWPIFTFATLGVVVSAFAVGTLFYYFLQFFGHPVDYIYCLLFGALISPTDPIAVMGVLKKAKVPESVEVKITGESLFNDGVALVLFISIFQIAQDGFGTFGTAEIVELLAMEVLGGIAVGLVMGYIVVSLMKTIDHYQTEVLLSLALALGSYSFATLMHMSGPLAVVIAGLIVGNKGKMEIMSDTTLDYLNKFWEMTDEILNAILFVLIGLEVLIVPYHFEYFIIGLITFVIVVAMRYVSLYVPSLALNLNKTFTPNALIIMTWGGIRGGISIALALSLTDAMEKELIVAITYTVVLLSIVIQGMGIGRLINLLEKRKL